MKYNASNINTIKYENNRTIFNCIRYRPMSRAEISKITGLSKSAVTVITKQLIDEGSLKEIGTESISYGRHPIVLDIVENHKFAIGIQLSRTKVSVCISTLKLNCLKCEEKGMGAFNSPEAVLDWAYSISQSMIKELKLPCEKCLGIGIAAPGPIASSKGVILTPSNFEMFHNFNVKEYLSKYTDMPIFIHNDTWDLAMYEIAKRRPEIKHFIYVLIDNGVGCAIVQNGSIRRGSSGYAGEMGHTTVDINGPQCECGNNGCLEGYVTEKAICSRYSVESYKSVVDKAYDGDKTAIEIIDDVAKYLSAGILNAINLVDTEAVIITGELNYRSEMLFSKIKERINNRAAAKKKHGIDVIESVYSDNINLAFSAANIVDKHFNQWIKQYGNMT